MGGGPPPKLKELQIEGPVMTPQDPPRIFKGPVFTPSNLGAFWSKSGRKVVEKGGNFFFRPSAGLKVLSWGGSLAKSEIKGPVDPPPNPPTF